MFIQKEPEMGQKLSRGLMFLFMKKKLKPGVDHPRVAQILKRKKERDVIQNRRLDAFFFI